MLAVAVRPWTAGPYKIPWRSASLGFAPAQALGQGGGPWFCSPFRGVNRNRATSRVHSGGWLAFRVPCSAGVCCILCGFSKCSSTEQRFIGDACTHPPLPLMSIGISFCCRFSSCEMLRSLKHYCSSCGC